MILLKLAFVYFQIILEAGETTYSCDTDIETSSIEATPKTFSFEVKVNEKIAGMFLRYYHILKKNMLLRTSSNH